ncbi:DUF2333 family protein [Halomonas caseinilytica]|uniref:DUF2333 family protein n=1 Tax=Halomonas caseinilytica TaxID=438744 RepID=UPI0007E5828E|nr:DUF2333 family protein [Halomonas caseinilytica]SEM96277.1 hypothetical protein SAMN04487952_108176 [Halomonas caseinilytica]
MGLTRKGEARRRSKVEVLERPQYGWIWKPLLVLLILYLVVTVALGVWWSRTPANFDVEEAVAEQRGGGTAEHGAVTVAGLRTTLATLLDKPGGYLRNDIAPPGLWLDNMPAWEFGVMRQARGLMAAMPAMSEGEASSLESAATRLRGDGRDWLYPSTEHHVRQAMEALDAYLAQLEEPGAVGFGDGGQGLADWLSQVAGSLDDLGGRLSASVGDKERLADLGVPASSMPESTPWYRVDNVFFEARGQAWALRHLLAAMRRDQADVIEAAGLAERWDALTVELERSQRRLWSPVVLNGSGFGIFANHSLVMASHVLRARDLVRELAGKLPESGEATAPAT